MSRLATAAAAAVVLVSTGCGGGSSPGPTAVHGHPDLEAFLALPVASPSTCPATVNGTTSGRRSPWAGTVDVSVFATAGTTDEALAALKAKVGALPDVAVVFTETADQAYAEFQRLYTCSAAVPRDSVHASLRLVLASLDLARRDALVATLLKLKGVETVSCDPAAPCVDVVLSAQPATPTPTHS